MNEVKAANDSHVRAASLSFRALAGKAPKSQKAS
jgi:hypothetical protein